MKIKDMVFLHDVNTMREFLENNGVHGATDNEIKAFYEVFEGHGYELFARSLKDDKFIRFDSCGSEIGDIDETDEEYVSINTINYELSYAWEMLDELYGEYLENDEEEQAFDCGIARNLVSDLYSRYLDKDKNKIYIVSYSSRSNFSVEDDNTVEVFYNEVDAYREIKGSLESVIKNEDVEQDYYSDCDFSNEYEVKKYMIDYREKDEFTLIYDGGSLGIKLNIEVKEDEEEEIKEESKMEFYTLVNDYINYNCYEKSVVVSHHRTKEDGLKEFKKTVEEYKYNWIDKNDYLDEGKLGDYDELEEYENDNISFFKLFLDDQCCIEVSLEKEVL